MILCSGLSCAVVSGKYWFVLIFSIFFYVFYAKDVPDYLQLQKYEKTSETEICFSIPSLKKLDLTWNLIHVWIISNTLNVKTNNVFVLFVFRNKNKNEKNNMDHLFLYIHCIYTISEIRSIKIRNTCWFSKKILYILNNLYLYNLNAMFLHVRLLICLFIYHRVKFLPEPSH